MGKPPEKLKSHDDDQTEHSSCGGIWHGVSMQRHCEYCMHKEHRYYKNDETKKRWGLLLWGGFKCEKEVSAGAEMHTEEGCIERDMVQRV
jgi:hypothetical protein